MTDNGPNNLLLTSSLTSSNKTELSIFVCSPYHPASNGLAERFVRTFKQAMKAGRADSLSLNIV